MKPEMITIVVGVVMLVITIVSAAWLNYNATMRVNQQLLEGIKIANHQLLEGLKIALEQTGKRFEAGFDALRMELRAEVKRLDERIALSSLNTQQEIQSLRQETRQSFAEMDRRLEAMERSQERAEQRAEHRIRLLEDQVEHRLHRMEMQITAPGAQPSAD